MRKLKVYGGDLFVNGKQIRAIVATTSMKKVAELTKLSLYEVKTYWGETGNSIELEIALAKPETIFIINDLMEKDFRERK